MQIAAIPPAVRTGRPRVALVRWRSRQRVTSGSHMAAIMQNGGAVVGLRARASGRGRTLPPWRSKRVIFEQGQKVLFIGDSITDCGRREGPHAPYGNGYVALARAF